MRRAMSNRDWLSLAEIARLWSEECGESADDLERDLDSWFTEFVAREPSQRPQRLVSPDRNPGRNGDNTNRLMGMLGGRHLERQTLEAYCEERGRPKPRFWFQCETPQRDATRPSKPAAGEPQAGSPQSGEKPPSVGPARDPDLESFQTQIADMSERLKAPGFEYSSLEQASADSQTDSASQSGDAAPSMDQYDRELIARADVASAKARELKMQLEAAEKRIARSASRISPSRRRQTTLRQASGLRHRIWHRRRRRGTKLRRALRSNGQRQPATGIRTSPSSCCAMALDAGVVRGLFCWPG
jgi:hypothetical protein